jgi:CrcB protein
MIALWVFIGGGLGSLARFGLSIVLQNYKPQNFPVATLMANLISCIIIALAVGLFAEKIQSSELKAFIVMGFCGGFSTFSTFSNESIELVKSGNYAIAIANVLISIILCFAVIFYLGMIKK